MKEPSLVLKVARSSPDKGALYAPGTMGCHEALHMASVAAEIVEAQLLAHPAIRQNEEWMKLAEAAHQSLFDLYQAIGQQHLRG